MIFKEAEILLELGFALPPFGSTVMKTSSTCESMRNRDIRRIDGIATPALTGTTSSTPRQGRNVWQRLVISAKLWTFARKRELPT